MLIKVCGLTNLADAEAALEAGADLLGFIFYEKSPRHVTPERVRAIVQRLSLVSRPGLAQTPRLVGVFVNRPAAEVIRVLDDCGLDLAQLHGEESTEDLERLRGRAFKALRPRSRAEAAAAAAFADLGPSSGPDLLIDAYHPVHRGGTGARADWHLAADLARRYRLLLAGGLTPTNVAAAIRQVRPWGVDVSSGVEAAPGRKDHVRLRAFIAAARSASVLSS